MTSESFVVAKRIFRILLQYCPAPPETFEFNRNPNNQRVNCKAQVALDCRSEMSMEPDLTVRPEQKIAKFSQGNANYCAITDTGTRAIATSSHGVALAIDLETEKPIKVQAFTRHESSVQQCALTSFGRAAATASLDGTVRVWNTERPSQEWKQLIFKDYNRALGVAMSRDGKTIAACFQKRSNQSGVIVVYEMPHFERITWWKTKKLDLFSGSIAISDDGAIVAHCSKTRAYAVQVSTAMKLGVNNPKSHKRWPVSGESYVAMSGDGCTLVVADDESLRILGLANNVVTELNGYQRSFRPFCTVSQSGNRIAAAIRGDKFRIWDKESGKVVTDVCGFEHHARGCALSQDGNILLTCSFDQTIFITNIERSMKNRSKQTNSSNQKLIRVESSEENKVLQSEPAQTESSDHAEIELIGDEQVTPEIEKDEKDDLSRNDSEVEVGRATSGRVSKLVQQLEEMAKQNDVEEAERNSHAKSDNSVHESVSEEEVEGEDVNTGEDDGDDNRSNQNENLQKEPEKPNTPKRTLPDPREVFSYALERFDRTSEKNLLHIQASEALDELFDESDLTRIGKYAKDDALLVSDVDNTWRINERQFIEAGIRVMTAIRASKTDKWTASFTGAAEDLENSLTIPQAVSLIVSVAGESSPEKETIISALEKNSESNGEVDYKSFLSAVRKLGLEVN